MKKKKTHESTSIKTLVIYCLVVFLLIFMSIAIKFFFIVKESKFDGKHRFTIAVTTEKQKSEVLSFDPQSNSVVVLEVIGDGGKHLQEILGLPIDVVVATPSLSSKDASVIMSNFFFHYTSLHSDITIYDIGRLLLLAKTAQAKDKLYKQVHTIDSQDSIDKLVSVLFQDQTIVDEKVTIQIVNATDQAGLAGKLERVLTNIGANVLAISSSHTIEKKSKITYSNDNTYTLTKLQKMLHISANKMQDKAISDIIIVLGEDMSNSSAF